MNGGIKAEIRRAAEREGAVLASDFADMIDGRNPFSVAIIGWEVVKLALDALPADIRKELIERITGELQNIDASDRLR